MGRLAEEVLDQDGNVLAALPQGGHGDLEDVQPVIEVLAKPTVGEHLSEVAIRGADHPDIDTQRPAAAEWPELPLLQHTQQFRLHREGKVPDLIEEQAPAVGQLEQALAIAVGTREGAADVPEKLALQQRLGDRRAVLGDERPRTPGSIEMERSGHELLAGAALSLDQDREARLGGPFQQLEDLLHRAAAPQQVAERIAVLRGLSQQVVFRAQLGMEPCVLDRDGCVMSESLQETKVLFGEAGARQAAVQVNGADDPIVQLERGAHQRLDVEQAH